MGLLPEPVGKRLYLVEKPGVADSTVLTTIERIFNQVNAG
jgi:hypothetical protein